MWKLGEGVRNKSRSQPAAQLMCSAGRLAEGWRTEVLSDVRNGAGLMPIIGARPLTTPTMLLESCSTCVIPLQSRWSSLRLGR